MSKKTDIPYRLKEAYGNWLNLYLELHKADEKDETVPRKMLRAISLLQNNCFCYWEERYARQEDYKRCRVLEQRFELAEGEIYFSEMMKPKRKMPSEDLISAFRQVMQTCWKCPLKQSVLDKV